MMLWKGSHVMMGGSPHVEEVDAKNGPPSHEEFIEEKSLNRS